MDTIVQAFEKQLDSLFGAEALDISTDITVLDNMMAREGLVDDVIHRTAAKPQSAPQPQPQLRTDALELWLVLVMKDMIRSYRPKDRLSTSPDLLRMNRMPGSNSSREAIREGCPP